MTKINDGGPDAAWIEWRGGDCPVPRDSLVMVRLRDGEQANSHYVAHGYDWRHRKDDPGQDIVAYYVLAERSKSQQTAKTPSAQTD